MTTRPRYAAMPGTPILVKDSNGRPRRDRVFHVASGRVWYSTGALDCVRLADYGTTWVYGWEGEAADAFAAQLLLEASA